MLRLVPKPPPSEPASEAADTGGEPEDEEVFDHANPAPRSGTRPKRGRPWWVDEFVAIEQRIRKALVRR
jgi:hypothetical protein